MFRLNPANYEVPESQPASSTKEFHIPKAIMHYTANLPRPTDPTYSHNRVSFTPYQLDLLLAIFSEFRYPNRAQKDIIAKLVGITREQVKVWYQNRRRKELNGKTVSTSSGTSGREVTKTKYVPDDALSAILAELHAHSGTAKDTSGHSKRKRSTSESRLPPKKRKLGPALPAMYQDLKFDLRPGFIPPNKVMPGAELLAHQLSQARKASQRVSTLRTTIPDDCLYPPNRVAPYEYTSDYLRYLFAYYYPHYSPPFSPFGGLTHVSPLYCTTVTSTAPQMNWFDPMLTPAQPSVPIVPNFRAPYARSFNASTHGNSGIFENRGPQHSKNVVVKEYQPAVRPSPAEPLRIRCEENYDIPALSPISPVDDVIADIYNANSSVGVASNGPPTVPYSSFTWDQTLPTFGTTQHSTPIVA